MSDADISKDPYELALAMFERASGFAFLLRGASDHFGSISHSELSNIARLAEDMAGKAAELLEATRTDPT